jgi:hypothetical protein
MTAKASKVSRRWKLNVGHKNNHIWRTDPNERIHKRRVDINLRAFLWKARLFVLSFINVVSRFIVCVYSSRVFVSKHHYVVPERQLN